MSRKKAETKSIRCAIYTRKSTEEGLQQEFNSLDAQRESAESFIESQRHEGWVALPDRFDDGGYSGGNMERPALRRLLAAVESGSVDAVVVYKVDRLSRSLLDFARIMEILDTARCSFVSVTQQFNTTHSMGRLTLNILLSFAQFEREIIAERTRDKLGAARRRGKWVGGTPFLGYDLVNGKLVPNQAEAELVRAVFELFISLGSVTATVEELNRRGWSRKRWIRADGGQGGGGPWTKSNLRYLIGIRSYIGEIEYRGEIYRAEHPAILDRELWERANALLGHRNHRQHHPNGALLRGLLRCGSCGTAMTHCYTSKGNRRYRYYVCSTAQKRGWRSCPTKSVPAAEIEAFVVERIRAIGADPSLASAVWAESRRQQDTAVAAQRRERGLLGTELKRLATEVKRAVGRPDAAESLAGLQGQIATAESRLGAVRAELGVLDSLRIDEPDVDRAMAAFNPVWEGMTPGERGRLVDLLIEQVEYDGAAAKISIRFRPTGIRSLAAGGIP